MRSAVLTLFLLCLIFFAKAQEPHQDSADSNLATSQHVRVPYHEDKIGLFVHDVTFTGKDGKEVSLSSYRGKPLLIDFWATWCGPCRAALPGLKRIYSEVKDKGMEFVSFDQVGDPVDEDKDAAAATKYLAQHHYEWKNFHDADRKVATALQCDGLPLVVVIDAEGQIVYFDFGGNEAELRKAIAGLGPEFASVAPADARRDGASPDSPEKD
jgi:thiol-disulfide isomerase/thioredoxin